MSDASKVSDRIFKLNLKDTLLLAYNSIEYPGISDEHLAFIILHLKLKISHWEQEQRKKKSEAQK